MAADTGTDNDRIVLFDIFPNLAETAQSQYPLAGHVGERNGHYFGQFSGEYRLSRRR